MWLDIDPLYNLPAGYIKTVVTTYSYVFYSIVHKNVLNKNEYTEKYSQFIVIFIFITFTKGCDFMFSDSKYNKLCFTSV